MTNITEHKWSDSRITEVIPTSSRNLKTHIVHDKAILIGSRDGDRDMSVIAINEPDAIAIAKHFGLISPEKCLHCCKDGNEAFETGFNKRSFPEQKEQLINPGEI